MAQVKTSAGYVDASAFVKTAAGYAAAAVFVKTSAGYVAAGGAAAFDPASLFSGSEKGAVINPKMMPSLMLNFQSNTGISAAGQLIHMAYDYKRGNLSRELRPKTGWAKTSGDGVVSVVGNTITITGATTTTRVDPSPSRTMKSGVVRLRVTYSTAGATGATIWTAGAPVTPSVGSNLNQQLSTNSALERVQIDTGSATFVIEDYDELPGNHAVQASVSLRSAYQVGPQRLVFDGVDDAMTMTFSASLGSACTVGMSIPGVGASILTAQTIGTSYTFTQSNCGLVVIDRSLTGPETANVAAWLTAQAF